MGNISVLKAFEDVFENAVPNESEEHAQKRSRVKSVDRYRAFTAEVFASLKNLRKTTQVCIILYEKLFFLDLFVYHNIY